MSTASNTPTPETLAQRFQMNHLVPESGPAAKAAVEKAVAPADTEAVDLQDPRFQKSWPFEFDHKDARGKLWVGKFTNTILNLRQRSLTGIMRAKLAGGLPSDSLDPHTAELNLMVAHLTFSLTEAPDWAKDLLQLDDQNLVGLLYDKAMEHEQFFRFGRHATPQGQGGGR